MMILNIDRDSVFPINARELHLRIGSGRNFSNWIKERINTYEFVELKDFTTNLLKTPTTGRPKLEYFITLSMAKELCMLQNNEIGKSYRKQLIEVEEDYRNKMEAMDDLELARVQINKMIEMRRAQKDHENRITVLESRNSALTGYLTIRGWCNLRSVRLDMRDSQTLGRLCVKMSNDSGYPINKMDDEMFGRVNSYLEDIIDESYKIFKGYSSNYEELPC